MQWLQPNDIPEGILSYNYNVLMTLTNDAIVITGGDNDTFPLWVLQDAMHIKSGVKVLNISLILKDDYRKKVFVKQEETRNYEKKNSPDVPVIAAFHVFFCPG